MADITNTPSETTTGETPRQDTPGARLAAKRAAKAARKASQRGTDQPGEEVTQKLLDANDWMDQHKASIWGGIAAILIVGGGVIAWSMHTNKRDAEGGALLLEAVVTSEGIISAGDEPAADEPILPTFESAAQRDEKALGQFRDAAKKVPTATAAAWARLGEANMLLATAKYEEADRAYAGVVAAAGEDEFLRVRALEGSGYALEAQKKQDAALKRFEEISSHGRGGYKSLGDYHRGRLLVAAGKRDEAVKLLQGIVKASAAKPADEPERFPTEIAAAQTLLEELGAAESKPVSTSLDALGAGGGKGEISEQVLDALRKQIEAQKSGATK